MSSPDENIKIFVPQSVIDGVLLLVNEWDMETKQLLVKERQVDLLGEYADLVLQRLLDDYEGQADFVVGLEWHRALLADCREFGITEAFARRMRPTREAELTPDVVSRLGALTDGDEILQFLAHRPGVRRLLAEATQELVNAIGARGKETVFRKEGDLLLTVAAELSLRHADSPDLRAHADLIAIARVEGIAAALAWAFGDEVETDPDLVLDPELTLIVNELLFTEATLSMGRMEEISRRGVALAEPRTPVWGVLKAKLAQSLVESDAPDRAERLEEAIAHYADVIGFLTDTGNTRAILSLRTGLSTAFRERIHGERGDNLDRAVEEAERAVAALEAGDDPGRIVMAHHTALTGYLGRRSGDDLLHAYRHATVAREHADPAGDRRTWLAVHQSLGNIAKAGGPDEYEDGGITYLMRAREAVDPGDAPDIWTMVSIDLAEALLERSDPLLPEDAAAAIEVLEQALTWADPAGRPEAWADIHNRLSDAYQWRRSGDDQTDFALAVDHAEQALTVFTRYDFPNEWASALSRRADGLRHLRSGSPLANGQAALDCYSELAEFYLTNGRDLSWARIQEKMAFAHASSNMVDFEPGHLALAIEHLERALEVFDRLGEADRAVQARVNLLSIGSGATSRGEDSAELVAKVREHGERALAEAPEDDQDVQYSIHRALGMLAFDQESAADARSHLELALATDSGSSASALDLYLPMAVLHKLAGDAGSALDLCRTAIELGERLIGQAASDAGKHHLISIVGQVYERLAFWRLKEGAWSQALTLLEQSKSRLVLDSLDHDLDLTAASEGTRSRIRRARDQVRRLQATLRAPSTAERGDGLRISRQLALARAELATALAEGGISPRDPLTSVLTGASLCRHIPAGGVLVAPIIAGPDAAMLVIPSGTAEPTEANVVWLPRVSSVAVTIAEKQWAQTEAQWELGNVSYAAWMAAIDTITSWLWTSVADPLMRALRNLGVGPDATLWLVSSSLTRQLPLHAAWRTQDDQRRAILDDHPVAYTPCVRLLHETARRAELNSARDCSITVFADPLGDLPSAGAEGRAISRTFEPGAALIVSGPAVTEEAVMVLAPERPYLHFACHASVNWIQPDFSSIVLADGFRLSAAELSGLDLTRTRLAVLSACKSGVTNIRRHSAEYTGLAAALLRSGTPAVAATLWSVDDEATALLMRRFYEAIVRDHAMPAVALRQAQLWLRDATIADLTATETPGEEHRHARWRLPGRDASERPYQNAFFWAGFQLVGT